MKHASPRDPEPTSVVAQRILAKSSNGTRIRLIVHSPARVSKDPEEWACPIGVRIGREPMRLVVTGRGVDSLQALLTGLGALRGALGREGEEMKWLGEPGALGLPMMVFDDDAEFLNLIEALVDAEYARRTFTLKRMRRLMSSNVKRRK